VEWWAAKERPVASHIYNKEEMAYFAEANLGEQSSTCKIPKTFSEIINAAYALQLFLEASAASNENPLPLGMHRPDRDYTDQQLVIENKVANTLNSNSKRYRTSFAEGVTSGTSSGKPAGSS
jgi:hypothetical protein